MGGQSSQEFERRVLLLAPTKRDADVTRALLAKVDLEGVVCADVGQLCAEIPSGAAAVLLTAEVLEAPDFHRLAATLEKQPSWSDLPIILLLQADKQAAFDEPIRSLGNVTLLERPAPSRSVVSAVRTAVRARQRQYQIRDHIAEQKQADAALIESRKRFEAMANSIPQLAWMARPDGWIFWYNQRWHSYCGTTPGAMEGWGWQSVHNPDELPRIVEKWQAALDSGEPWEDLFTLRRFDGEFRWHLSRAMPFRDDSGQVVFWFGTNTDITEERTRAEAKQQLLEAERTARAEAERLSQMKDEFLATLSHELRTPLNAIFGWTQILRMGQGNPATVKDAVTVIDRNVRLQTQLIDDLLDVSRIISGKVRLDVQRVDLPELIDAAIESVRPAADAKQLRLEKIIDPSAGPISGDPSRLQQVLWNLLTNAIKFTPKSGKVQIVLERVNSHVEVRVVDTGIGIVPEFLPLLFERFSQADASTTRRHGGLGLGLSIVKNLVELHGGLVRAKSAGEGLGATFSIQLPIRASIKGLEKEEARPSTRDCVGAGVRLQ